MRRALPAAMAALALVSAGCEGQRRRRAAERAVRAYAEALTEAYRMSDASRLRDVAGEKEVGRVRVLIDLKRSSGLVLESRIESFTVTGVRAAGPDVRSRAARGSACDPAATPGALHQELCREARLQARFRGLDRRPGRIGIRLLQIREALGEEPPRRRKTLRPARHRASSRQASVVRRISKLS